VYLSTARNRMVTDSRDRIYGLLGILPDVMAKGTTPNYKLDIATVFSRSTKYLLKTTQTLKYIVQVNITSKNPYVLPLWTLSRNENDSVNQFVIYYYFASGEFNKYISTCDEPNEKTLAVEATFVGQVGQIGTFQITTPCPPSSLRTTLSSWRKLVLEVAGIEKDDWICICKGIPFPFVLRRHEGGMYSLVCISYVHGIMEGQATKDAEWKTVYLC
jgi:hypothetical protein